jgi:hypothetical protein
MIRTTITHGHLRIELCEDGSMQIVHEKLGLSMMLSKTEWIYVQMVAQLHGWPIAPADVSIAGISDTPANG